MEHKSFTIKSKIDKANDEQLQITHYISTTTKDRYGDVVNPKGFNENNFRKNPIVLFGHDGHRIPIAKNLWLKSEEKGVLALTQFDNSPIGKDMYRLNKEGFLNAWSIGFIPNKQYQKEEKDNDGKIVDKYNYIDEWELLEYSSVPIPANPDCINLMFKDIQSPQLKEIFQYYELQEKVKLLEMAKDESLNLLLEIVKASDSMVIQTILFSKEIYDKEKTIAWCKAHNFKYGDIRETEDNWRSMQIPPEDFDESTFRTIDITKGIRAIVGKLKKEMSNLENIDIDSLLAKVSSKITTGFKDNNIRVFRELTGRNLL